MIALDSNILIYSHRRDSPFHKAAAQCVRSLATGKSTWAIPWPCIHEFLAIVTHPRIYDPPSPGKHANSQVDAWLASPSLSLLSEARTHWAKLSELAIRGKISGSRFHDARIAAICVEHGVRELWTADRDFSRFPALNTRNPLLDW